MDKYKKYQLIASACVALFIVSAALCILVRNRSVYEECVSDNKITAGDMNISGFEAKLNYGQLADDFCSFFNSDYSLPGYDISAENQDKLNAMKGYYRGAWLIAAASFIGAVYSFIILSKRRLYMPFLYGGVFAAFLTSINAFIIMRSNSPVLSGIRSMVLYEDYGYFSGDDILTRLLPPEFARHLAIAYILIVFLLILAMAFIRFIIIYRGRPHKF